MWSASQKLWPVLRTTNNIRSAVGTPITTKEACTLIALKWQNIINYQWKLAISTRGRDSCWCNKAEQGKWAVTQCDDYQWDCRLWSAWYSWTSWLNNTATPRPPATYTCERHSLPVHRVCLWLKGWSGSVLHWEKESSYVTKCPNNAGKSVRICCSSFNTLSTPLPLLTQMLASLNIHQKEFDFYREMFKTPHDSNMSLYTQSWAWFWGKKRTLNAHVCQRLKIFPAT